MWALVSAIGGGLAWVLAFIPGVGPVIKGAQLFFSSSIGKIALVGLIVVGLYGTGFVRGTIRANNKCEAANLRVDLARERLALNVEKQAVKDTREALDKERELKDASDQQVKALQDELAKRGNKNVQCRVTPADRKRLLSIPVR